MRVKLTKTSVHDQPHITGDFFKEPTVGEAFLLGKTDYNEGWRTLPVTEIIDDNNFRVDNGSTYRWEVIHETVADSWTLTDDKIKDMAFNYLADKYKVQRSEVILLYDVQDRETVKTVEAFVFAYNKALKDQSLMGK